MVEGVSVPRRLKMLTLRRETVVSPARDGLSRILTAGSVQLPPGAGVLDCIDSDSLVKTMTVAA